jgi:hypothetical protein
MGLNTQQDPIGIARGLNLYGYAGGDPINFGDPFGLAAVPECEGIEDDQEWAQCWLEWYAAEQERRAKEATEEAQFYEAAECVASGVAWAGALATDAAVLATSYAFVKAGVAAMTGAVWEAGLAWQTGVGAVGDRVVERGMVMGSKVASEYAGPSSTSVSEYVANALVQTPRATERFAKACSR